MVITVSNNMSATLSSAPVHKSFDADPSGETSPGSQAVHVVAAPPADQVFGGQGAHWSSGSRGNCPGGQFRPADRAQYTYGAQIVSYNHWVCACALT